MQETKAIQRTEHRRETPRGKKKKTELQTKHRWEAQRGAGLESNQGNTEEKRERAGPAWESEEFTLLFI